MGSTLFFILFFEKEKLFVISLSLGQSNVVPMKTTAAELHDCKLELRY
jgi:hypothetical protein